MTATNKQSFKNAAAHFRNVSKQVKFATSHAITQSLWYTRGVLQRDMSNYTSFTTRRLLVKKATKRDLVGMLYFPPEVRYMHEQIYGGRKDARGRRIPEPVNSPLTSKGNFRRGYLQEAMRLASVPRNGQWSRIKDRRQMHGSQGYSLGESKTGHYGLWKWTGSGKGRKVKLLVSLNRPSREQRITWPANTIAEHVFSKRFPKQWPVSVRFAVR